jgi:AmmeMemoRadiSam system protein A
MAPSSSPDQELLQLAALSVRQGLDGDGPLRVDTDTLADPLQERCGVFVTLLVDGKLNGCVGTLSPNEPVGAAVARLAWNAAFADPRLPQLKPSDYELLTVKVSLLSPLEPMSVSSLEELVAALCPHVDGLLLTAAGKQATFLPAVWEKLSDPIQFVRQLQLKAGMRPGSWSARTQAFRYTTREVTGRPSMV